MPSLESEFRAKPHCVESKLAPSFTKLLLLELGLQFLDQLLRDTLDLFAETGAMAAARLARTILPSESMTAIKKAPAAMTRSRKSSALRDVSPSSGSDVCIVLVTVWPR